MFDINILEIHFIQFFASWTYFVEHSSDLTGKKLPKKYIYARIRTFSKSDPDPDQNRPDHNTDFWSYTVPVIQNTG
jgi:hypothetical protein